MSRHLNKNPVRRVGEEPFIGFVRVPNDVARAPISLAARGIILELASHQDGYAISVEDIAANAGCSWRSANRVLHQALESGYLARTEYRTSRGHAYFEYFVRTDRPFTDEEQAQINVVVTLPEKAAETSADESSAATYTEPFGDAQDPAEERTAANAVPSGTDTPICNLCNEPVTADAYEHYRGTWHRACLQKRYPDVDLGPAPGDPWNESPPPRTEHVRV